LAGNNLGDIPVIDITGIMIDLIGKNPKMPG
jgi:hypothetical protein